MSDLPAESANHTCCNVGLRPWRRWIRGIVPMAYIAMPNGSPCGVPSQDQGTLPRTCKVLMARGSSSSGCEPGQDTPSKCLVGSLPCWGYWTRPWHQPRARLQMMIAQNKVRRACTTQCCQVPVLVCIFTEIRPGIRSTEMQWSIPQIWKNQNRFRKVSISNKFQFQIDYAPCLGDRSVNQLAADQVSILPETRYYLSTRLATRTLSFSSYTSLS